MLSTCSSLAPSQYITESSTLTVTNRHTRVLAHQAASPGQNFHPPLPAAALSGRLHPQCGRLRVGIQHATVLQQILPRHQRGEIHELDPAGRRLPGRGPWGLYFRPPCERKRDLCKSVGLSCEPGKTHVFFISPFSDGFAHQISAAVCPLVHLVHPSIHPIYLFTHSPILPSYYLYIDKGLGISARGTIRIGSDGFLPSENKNNNLGVEGFPLRLHMAMERSWKVI